MKPDHGNGNRVLPAFRSWWSEMTAHKEVLFVGSSGLIGALALQRMLDNAGVGKVYAPVRRGSGVTDPKLVEVVGAFGDAAGDARIEAALGQAHPQVFVCTLGTTIAAAGSQQAFSAIDRDLVLHMAALALRRGAKQAIVVSSIGADASARNFYLRTKGRMERDLSALGFVRCDFMHPGLLLGPRRDSTRSGEGIAQRLAPIYNPLLLGPLRRYRAIPADAVAAKLVSLIGENSPGVFRHEFDAMTSA